MLSASIGATVKGAQIGLEDGGAGLLCFVAEAGGVPVAGATWTLSAMSALEIDATRPSCAIVELPDAGTGTLTVTASGFSRTFDLVAAPSDAGHARSVRPAAQALPGHRARGAS